MHEGKVAPAALRRGHFQRLALDKRSRIASCDGRATPLPVLVHECHQLLGVIRGQHGKNESLTTDRVPDIIRVNSITAEIPCNN